MGAYRIQTDAFDGPFDLLLRLVVSNKIDVCALSLDDIVVQYLHAMNTASSISGTASVSDTPSFEDADTSAPTQVSSEVSDNSADEAYSSELASDFLSIASSLLELKASRLLPRHADEQALAASDDEEELEPLDARCQLLEKLLTYYQLRTTLAPLLDARARRLQMHARCVGRALEFPYAKYAPVKASDQRLLARALVRVAERQTRSLLSAEHIGKPRAPLSETIGSLRARLSSDTHVSFWDFIGAQASPERIVASFLAVLELYKQNEISIKQPRAFGDMQLVYTPHQAQ